MPTPPRFTPEAGDPTWHALRPTLLLPADLYRDYSRLRWDAFRRDVLDAYPNAALDPDASNPGRVVRLAWSDGGRVIAESLSWSPVPGREWGPREYLAGAILPGE